MYLFILCFLFCFCFVFCFVSRCVFFQQAQKTKRFHPPARRCKRETDKVTRERGTSSEGPTQKRRQIHKKKEAHTKERDRQNRDRARNRNKREARYGQG